MASIENAYNEYKNLLSDLKNENATKDLIYEKLMAKEDKILDLIGRVANQKNTSLLKDSVFYNQSLFEIIMNFANAWKNIFHEVVIEKRSLKLEGLEVFYNGDRKIYVGMMIIFISLLFFFIDAAI